MTEIAILGAGMAGFGAAHHLRAAGGGARGIVYERRDHYGGHTSSYCFDSGFVFDEGGHVSFTKDERIQRMLAENVRNDYQTLHTRVNNYWNGHWIKHPAQCNLYGLPPDLVAKVLHDFIEARYRENGDIRTYRDWLVATFGRTFAETFPMEYGLKYHTTTADNMTTEWIGPRLYQPSLEEVLRGALSPTTPDVHYISHFRYPSRGGFASYLRPWAERMDLRLQHEVVAIDPRTRELRFKNGARAHYDRLISSMPLPELIPLIAGAPADVREAAARLACTTVVIVTLGVNRPDLIDAHWTYFYDRDLFFTRLNTPHLQSPNNVPPGCGALQVECYYSPKYRPLDRQPDECVALVIADLKRVGVLRDDDQIVFQHSMLIPYANVIFDLERPAALATVHGYLEELGILACGRYGEWGYLWTDEAFKSGERAAERALSAG